MDIQTCGKQNNHTRSPFLLALHRRSPFSLHSARRIIQPLEPTSSTHTSQPLTLTTSSPPHSSPRIDLQIFILGHFPSNSPLVASQHSRTQPPLVTLTYPPNSRHSQPRITPTYCPVCCTLLPHIIAPLLTTNPSKTASGQPSNCTKY